ncbi:MAG: guanylate kinase [Lachnospira sp.]|nr:guanylate kinase [Lachnospira sp.]
MPGIAFIMGKSASGKDKIFKMLMEDERLCLKNVTMYTTRPMRVGETEGIEYHFVDERKAQEFEEADKIIEMRSYTTMHGVWKYFTADDGQIDLAQGNRYIVIGTLEAYDKFCKYYGKEHILPIYIEVDDGIRLMRAVNREMKQENPKYAELCRRFLADEQDFSETNIQKSGITKRFFNNNLLEECYEEIAREIAEKMCQADI